MSGTAIFLLSLSPCFGSYEYGVMEGILMGKRWVLVSGIAILLLLHSLLVSFWGLIYLRESKIWLRSKESYFVFQKISVSLSRLHINTPKIDNRYLKTHKFSELFGYCIIQMGWGQGTICQNTHSQPTHWHNTLGASFREYLNHEVLSMEPGCGAADVCAEICVALAKNPSTGLGGGQDSPYPTVVYHIYHAILIDNSFLSGLRLETIIFLEQLWKMSGKQCPSLCFWVGYSDQWQPCQCCSFI